MKTSTILARLEAWRRGAPVPIGETVPWPRAEAGERLVLAFVRMAGESRPWGFAAGHPGGEPEVFTVPEPRDAEESARLAEKLAAILLPHLPHPETVPEEQRGDVAAAAGNRQLWMPGATHVEMLHFLDYRYTFASVREDPRARELATLGRAAGFLFRESNRPGQVRVFDATARLRDAFAIPAEDVRQAHLGFLLAWIAGGGTREERVAEARRAERESVGVTLSPSLERDTLQELVGRWNEHRADPARAAKAAAEIHAVLAPELIRRFHLTVAAIDVLEADRQPNAELKNLVALGVEELTYQYWNHELKAAAPVTDPDAPRFYGDHPESDFLPTHAAARFFAHQHAAETTTADLVHGDRARLAEAIEHGDAIRGTIARVVNEGTKRATVPVWTVIAPADGPLRLREESMVSVVGLRGRTGKIRAITAEGWTRTVIVEIDGWKRARPDEGAPAADSPALAGTEVTLVDAGSVGISKRKSMRVWDASGPGAWLTHAAPPPAPAVHAAIEGDLVALVEKLGGA